MTNTLNKDEFLTQEKTRLGKYYRTNKTKLTNFGTNANFTNWYLLQLSTNEYKCHYCQTSIFEIRSLLNHKIINGRNVRGGAWRGPNFELDRKDPNGLYTEENCVLSCYFCNNDKSNTYSYPLYKNVIGPLRKQMWQNIKKSEQ